VRHFKEDIEILLLVSTIKSSYKHVDLLEIAVITVKRENHLTAHSVQDFPQYTISHLQEPPSASRLSHSGSETGKSYT
jgi:hypothetical protein